MFIWSYVVIWKNTSVTFGWKINLEIFWSFPNCTAPRRTRMPKIISLCASLCLLQIILLCSSPVHKVWDSERRSGRFPSSSNIILHVRKCSKMVLASLEHFFTLKTWRSNVKWLQYLCRQICFKQKIIAHRHDNPLANHFAILSKIFVCWASSL